MSRRYAIVESADIALALDRVASASEKRSGARVVVLASRKRRS